MGTYQYVGTVQSCACGAEISQIEIGGTIVGIAGLRGIFSTFHKAGREPDPALADELLAMVKVYNYVAPNSDEEYKVALLREYTRYWQARQPRDKGSVPSAPVTEQPKPAERGPIAKVIGIVRRLSERLPPASRVPR